MISKIRNALRAFLLKWGSPKTKDRIWSGEFSSGRWSCLDNTDGDCVYPVIKKYCRGGAILDLGCGSGNTGTELGVDCYSTYTGVDVSEAAVRKAIEKTNASGRGGRNQYVQADIESYAPPQKYDVILLRDSIYYIPFMKVRALLNRYRTFLREEGTFIVRMFDKNDGSSVVSLIESDFSLIEKQVPDEGKTVILVFR